MPIKIADDKSKRLALLIELQKSRLLDQKQKSWAREELVRFQRGIQGERDAAFYLDSHFKDSTNHVVLHDLRLECDGEVAQIDHLVFNRGIGIYLIETKNFSGNLSINEYGEFTVQYSHESFGIPSPLEQSRRHETVLKKVLERLGIAPRAGTGFDCYHVVLLNTSAKITRPAAKALDTSNVIKADQFPSWRKEFVDKELGAVSTLKMAANLRSYETIKEWGEKLARQHRPTDLLSLPAWMAPKPELQAPVKTVVDATPVANDPQPVAKKLICVKCSKKISFPEGKFCWNNAARFGGLQYCREHQSDF